VFYEPVFRAFNRARVRYLVVGGVAVVLRGSDRLTADLDIMLDLEEGNLKRAIRVLSAMGFRPRAPVALKDFANAETRERWRREMGMLVMGLANDKDPLLSVDIMTESPIEFGPAYLRRETVRMSKLRVPVASVSDLIRMKRKSGRPHDLDDMAFLKAAARLKQEARTE